MSYRLDVTREARGEIRALPQYVRARARKLVRALGLDPRPARARQLCEDPAVYRIWLAGRWRIAYAVDDEQDVIHVLRVRRKILLDFEGLDSSDYIHQVTDSQGFSLPAKADLRHLGVPPDEPHGISISEALSEQRSES